LLRLSEAFHPRRQAHAQKSAATGFCKSLLWCYPIEKPITTQGLPFMPSGKGFAFRRRKPAPQASPAYAAFSNPACPGAAASAFPLPPALPARQEA
jgi:hypothetical protein